MTDVADIARSAAGAANSTQAKVPAAKLHVLALAPLKTRLDTKWPRLSELVHKLFETAIARAQGPGDYFAKLDELSYIAIFRSLTVAEATQVCAAIAREVCQALFGDQVEEVSVRNVVSTVVVPSGSDLPRISKLIEAMLEREGTEIVFAQSTQCTPPMPVAAISETVLKPPAPELDRLADIHTMLSDFSLKASFFPVWSLQRGLSSSLFLSAVRSGPDKLASLGGLMFDEADPKIAASIEFALLDAVSAYAGRISAVEQVCALGVGVSYETLTVFQSRIRYITALQKLRLQPSTPLILKIEKIPPGTPAARLGELAAMLKLPNIHVALEFQSLRAIPKFEFRLSAMALGSPYPNSEDRETAVKFIKDTVALCARQKLLLHLSHLDSAEAVQIARRCNVRLGTGTYLSTVRFTGLEKIPNFPLALPR